MGWGNGRDQDTEPGEPEIRVKRGPMGSGLYRRDDCRQNPRTYGHVTDRGAWSAVQSPGPPLPPPLSARLAPLPPSLISHRFVFAIAFLYIHRICTTIPRRPPQTSNPALRSEPPRSSQNLSPKLTNCLYIGMLAPHALRTHGLTNYCSG